jgi:outer membrane receptor protein involved in Fe transport
VGDGFVYVRGLGERYSSAQMNGALMATTEPEKRVVPLDLFPAALIENIRIMKTYAPDMPAEFSGGLVQMQTIDFPTQRIFNVSFKTGYNARTTFDRFFTYPGGSYDFFGFDDGTRGVPSLIPSNKRLFPGAFSPAEMESFGEAFADNWEPTLVESIRPQFDWSAVGGGTLGRVGLIGAVTFGNKPQFQTEIQRYLRQGIGAPIIFTEYPDFREYTEQAKLGGVLNGALRLTPGHQILFRNTLTHDTEKSAREFSGYDGGVDSDIQSQRLRWVERTLLLTGVEGDHSFPNLGNTLIHWQFTYSGSRRYEPDLREVFRGKLPDGSYVFSALGSSGIRFFSDLHDKIYEPQLDYSIPFAKGTSSGLIKTGFRATLRRRDFQARRFRYIPQQSSTLNLFLPSNQLFARENIRPDGFQIVEYTRGTDRYDAEMNIFAGYGMVDLALGPTWRFTGGVRIEGARQEVTTVDNLVPNAQSVTASLENTDPAPVINAIYSLTPTQNLRVSYSRTVSRPDFRELSPFDFNNVLGGFVTQGNANLKRATINNYDLRWEKFSLGNQLIAASFFAKTFTDPIEQTILPSNDLRQTFVNAQGARNMGFELEFRRSLQTLSSKLNAFSVSANFTLVDSSVDISPEDASLLTSSSRPLLGQSRYITNVITEWNQPRWHSTARFFVNFVSRRLSDVGTFELPDLYQEGNTVLDFAYQLSLAEEGKGTWNLRFEAENLGDTEYRWTQGDIAQRRYRAGRTFQIGLSYSFF